MNNEQQNGNTQLNQDRNAFNDRVSRFLRLGATNRIVWTGKRRYRTI